MLHNIILSILILGHSVIYSANTATVFVDNAKIRSCPGLSCKLLGELPIDTKLTLLEALHMEDIGKYGKNRWYRIKHNNQDAYIFGGLLKVPASLKVPQKLTGLVKVGANIRSCPSRDCPIIEVKSTGDYLTVLNKANSKWYKIRLGKGDKKKTFGYIHSSLISESPNYLIINFQHKAIYDIPNGTIMASVSRGDILRISYRLPKSELIHPHGRYYWYKVYNGKMLGWVFGAGTTKENDPVDCQCVDYVKRKLNITGATRNAFEWSHVLTGQQTVRIKNVQANLKYRKVSKPKVGDIAVFNKHHPKADSLYGHIGFVTKIVTDSADVKRILVTGANHKEKYINMRVELNCGNVSEKWYEHNAALSYFRKE